MGYQRLTLESYFPDDEITRYGFITHMESFIKQLLQNPRTAKVDDYLMKFGIDSPKALLYLLKRTNPEDETSAVLIRKETIKPDEESVEDGVVPKDKFHIKYKLPRKDYMKKMRNLYISIFENHMANNDMLNEENANKYQELSKVKIDNDGEDMHVSFGKNGHGLTDELTKLGKKIEKLSKKNNIYLDKAKLDGLDDVYDLYFKVYPFQKSEINEGAWGEGILQNDSALDYQTSFFKEVLNKFVIDIVGCGKDADLLWAKCGVFIDFLKKFKNDKLHFTDEYNNCIMFVRKKLNILKNDKTWLNAWKNPKEIKREIEHLGDDLIKLIYDKSKLNVPMNEEVVTEDGEGGGATSCDSSSGQFVQPLFGKPIKRKTIYLTQEQLDYLKEEVELDTVFGDFGYDAPPFANKKDPAYNHKNMLKKSFEREEE